MLDFYIYILIIVIEILIKNHLNVQKKCEKNIVLNILFKINFLGNVASYEKILFYNFAQEILFRFFSFLDRSV